MKADAAAAGDVGVSGGVDASHRDDDFSSASVSTLSVRSSGRPDVTSSRDVTRRSTAPSLPLPVPTSLNESMTATTVCPSSVSSVCVRRESRRYASNRSAPTYVSLQLVGCFEANRGLGWQSAGGLRGLQVAVCNARRANQ